MLGDYLTFNNEQFPNPIDSKMGSKTIENVSQSESGGDLVVIVRPSKKSWNFKFNVVRVRDFQEELVEGSEWLSSVDGLYVCSVKVTEF